MENRAKQIVIIKAMEQAIKKYDNPRGSYGFLRLLDCFVNHYGTNDFTLLNEVASVGMTDGFTDSQAYVDSITDKDAASIMQEVSHWYLNVWSNRLV